MEGTRARRWWTAVAMVAALTIGMAGGPASAAGGDEQEERALEAVARRAGVPPSQLKVLAATEADYPLSDATADAFKIVDEAGRVHEVILDEQGFETDAEALVAAEQLEGERRYGRLHPDLARLLEEHEQSAQLGDGAQADVPVLIWLDEQQRTPRRPQPGARITQAQARELRAQVDRNRSTEVRRVAAPMVDRLARLGIRGTASEQSPVVAATVSLDQVSEVADLPGVDTVYLDTDDNEPELDFSIGASDAAGLQAAGVRGNGVRVGVIEVGGRAAGNNPLLSVAVQDATSACGSASAHTTAVAGIIRATPGVIMTWPFTISSNLRGMASAAELRVGGSCGGVSSELQARSTAAADWGARALNLSWGSDTSLVPGANDRFYDDLSRNRAITVVKSAGNTACGGTGNVTSPGLGYNMITVGNVDTRRTAPRGDDVMSGCSSFRNPTSTRGDRTKPELAAPGTNIQTTTTGFPWTGNAGSGTSYAAPMVTGAAAMLIQRQPSLAFWPEQVKAILMATAMNNIEGATRLSNVDGAGMISVSRADNVARGVNGRTGGRFYSCGTEPAQTELTNVFVWAGTRVRAAISWSVDTTFQDYPNRPSADLDLWFEGPSGTTYSSSWDNNYEIVDFVAPSSGTYRLKVNKYRCDRDAFLGHAIHLGS